jgi:hypothetical protein
MSLAFVAASLAFWMAPPAFATTHVSTTTYNTNTTWTAANSPYVIDGDVTVATGVTLTVDPGVIVKFNGQFRRLLVNGTLYAVGTGGNPIYFTSLQDDSVGGDTGGDGATTGAAGQWFDMEFKNSTSTDIEYATVRYGGYGSAVDYGALKIWSGAVLLDHDTITHNLKSGVVLAGNTVTPAYPAATVRHTDVTNNTYGIYVNTATLTLADNSSVNANTSYGVKFNLPSGSSPSVSSIFHSSVGNNGDWGVFLGVGNTFSTSLYPYGESNNIDGNAGFVNSTLGNIGQLYVPYVNASDDWEFNFFNWLAYDAPCALGPSYTLVSNNNAPGPVSATQYTGVGNPPPHCYANNVDTLWTVAAPIDNSGY